MEKVYKSCQSCGMPLKRDLQKGGTNSDGSRSQKFCSHCYQNGKFVQPDITLTQMQEQVKGKMKEMGFPKIMGGMFSRGIPKLERWKKSN